MYTNEYKYLRVVLNEHLDFDVSAKYLAKKHQKPLVPFYQSFIIIMECLSKHIQNYMKLA